MRTTRPRSRLRPLDLLGEIWEGILQRPGRSALTMTGTLLGIGTLVAILGLTATAAGQVSQQFSRLDATQASLSYSGASLGSLLDGGQRLDRLHGVRAAGVYWQVPDDIDQVDVSTTPGDQPNSGSGLDVYAASPGLLTAAQAGVSQGALYNSFHEDTHQPVALLGSVAAETLGISDVRGAPAIFLDGVAYTVVGIMQSNARLPQIDLGVVIPASDALAQFGPPDSAQPASFLILTQLGAAPQVAAEAPYALDAYDPEAFSPSAAPSPTVLAQSIGRTVSDLLVLLGLVAVVVGAFGITNTTLVSVMERTSEIGLRRSLGARRYHVAAQFLVESGAIGLIGGLIGTALGVLAVVAVALARDWTAILSPLDVFFPPLAGALVGLVAGAYPAWRAARIEPTEALRR